MCRSGLLPFSVRSSRGEVWAFAKRKLIAVTSRSRKWRHGVKNNKRNRDAWATVVKRVRAAAPARAM